MQGPYTPWRDRSEEAVYVWQSSTGDLWAITFELFDFGGHLECVGVEVVSYSDDETAAPRPLLGQTLRELPFATILALARRSSASRLRNLADGFSVLAANPPEQAAGRPLLRVAASAPGRLRKQAGRIDLPRERKAARRAAYTREDLERVARVYREAYGDPQTGGRYSAPAKAVAEALNVSRSQAGKLIMRCRAAGLLGQTQRGVAGGVDSAREDEEQ